MLQDLVVTEVGSRHRGVQLPSGNPKPLIGFVVSEGEREEKEGADQIQDDPRFWRM